MQASDVVHTSKQRPRPCPMYSQTARFNSATLACLQKGELLSGNQFSSCFSPYSFVSGTNVYSTRWWRPFSLEDLLSTHPWIGIKGNWRSSILTLFLWRRIYNNVPCLVFVATSMWKPFDWKLAFSLSFNVQISQLCYTQSQRMERKGRGDCDGNEGKEVRQGRRHTNQSVSGNTIIWLNFRQRRRSKNSNKIVLEIYEVFVS